LLPPDAERAYALRHALAIALSGFSADGAGAGGIALGARRSRGFGRCVVREWSFTEYPLADNVEGLLAWIAAEHSGWTVGPTRTWSGDAAAALGAGESHRLGPDARRRCKITAQFAVAPLLIRSTEPLIPEHELSDDQELHLPDVSHLRSYRPDKDVTAVVPGTSLAGVLRSRATMILNTLAPNHSARTQALIDAVFGFDMHRGSSDEARPTASRLIVEEQALTSGNLMVQNRVAIDRFTGGAFDTALFSEAPWFNGMVNICLTLRHDAISADNGAPHQQIRIEQAQIGLLLLLLKDLWTGDLPLGGGASVGRGRLTGVSADIHIYNEPVRHLQTTEHGFSVDPETVAALEPYVTALHTYLEVA
jgi:CRISPR/Cas system CSM-associated protein Csm3 (group 7 of RAMP superfamily)